MDLLVDNDGRIERMTREELVEKAAKGGPYLGPRGGKYADPQHKIPWSEHASREGLSHREVHERAAQIKPGMKVTYQGYTGEVQRISGDAAAVDFGGGAAESILTHRLKPLASSSERSKAPTRGPSLQVATELARREGATVQDLGAALGAGDYSSAKLNMLLDHAQNIDTAGGKRLVDAIRSQLKERSTAKSLPSTQGADRGTGLEKGDHPMDGAPTAFTELDDYLHKAGGPFIGPRGGKWADPRHTIPWKEGAAAKPTKPTKPKAKAKTGIKTSKKPPSVRTLIRAKPGTQVNWTSDSGRAFTAEKVSGSRWEIRSGGEVVGEVLGSSRMTTSLGGGSDFFIERPDDEGAVTKGGGLIELDDYLQKAAGAPFIGPRGGKWADPKHTIPFKEGIPRYKLEVHGKTKKEAQEAAKRVSSGIQRAADICKIDPPICEGNLGIPRKDMPQLPKEVIPKFLAHMAKQGAKVERNQTMAVGKLKATQREINAEKVQGMAAAYEAGKFDPSKEPIIVSNDGYILDGHHRWAAMLHLGPGNMMNVHKVDAPIKKILEEANAFEGVSQAGFGAPSAVAKSMVLGEALSWALSQRPSGDGLDELGSYLNKGRAPQPGERFEIESGVESGPPSVEKIMSSAFENLSDYIEKAGSAGGLPTGEPDYSTGVEVQRPEDGGKLAGVGESHGSPAPKVSYWDKLPEAKHQMLSDDDAGVDDQMKPHKKPIESGATRKSLAPDVYTAQEGGHEAAHPRAALTAMLRKGEADVTAGVGLAPKQDEPAIALEKARVWNQGHDAMVRYSEASDLATERLQKSDGFYAHGSPTLGAPAAMISQSALCKSCGSHHAAMLTACPSCGVGITSISPAPGVVLGGRGMVLEKSFAGPGLRAARTEQDLCLPDGFAFSEPEQRE